MKLAFLLQFISVPLGVATSTHADNVVLKILTFAWHWSCILMKLMIKSTVKQTQGAQHKRQHNVTRLNCNFKLNDRIYIIFKTLSCHAQNQNCLLVTLQTWQSLMIWREKRIVRRIGSDKHKECKIEPRHDKTNKGTECPAKTQISLGIHPVRSESSLCA